MDDSRDDRVSPKEKDGVGDGDGDGNENVDGDSGADVDGTNQMADLGENRLEGRLDRRASPIPKPDAIWTYVAF